MLHLIQSTAQNPSHCCPSCPLFSLCSWLIRGQPALCPLVMSHFFPSLKLWSRVRDHFPSLPEHGCSGWPYLLSLSKSVVLFSSPTLLSLQHILTHTSHLEFHWRRDKELSRALIVHCPFLSGGGTSSHQTLLPWLLSGNHCSTLYWSLSAIFILHTIF